MRNAKAITRVGPETVDAVETTKYDLTLDEVEAAIWLDENNRIVQMEHTMDTSLGSSQVTTKFYDFDVPNQIEAPI